MTRFVIAALLALLPVGTAFGGQVLLVDKMLLDPIAFTPFFEHFADNGMEFHYRRFHPTLVENDVERFDVIIVAGGLHHTEIPAATHLIPEEAALLRRFVEGGGTAVLLMANEYTRPDHTDNHIFNVLLDSLGLKIRAEGNYIQDPVGYKSTLVPSSYYLNLPRVEVSPDTPMGEGITEPFCGGRLLSILVAQQENIEIPAYSSSTSMRRLDLPSTSERNTEGIYAAEPRSYAAVVAAKAGKGHVVLSSRWLFNLNGFTGKWSDKPLHGPYDLAVNRRFEANFVRYVSQLASGLYELRNVIPIRRLDGLKEIDERSKPELKFRRRALRAAAHPQDYVELPRLDVAPAPRLAVLGGEKARIAYAGFPKAEEAERWCLLFKEAGYNLVNASVGGSYYQAREDPERVQALIERWEANLEVYQRHGMKVLLAGYIPYTHLWRSREYPTQMVDGTGRSYEVPSPLDAQNWEECLLEPARIFARLAAKYPDTIVGTLWDFEIYTTGEIIVSESSPFGTLPFMTFVRREAERLQAQGLAEEAPFVDQARRFQWLEANGLLDVYYACMEDEIFEMARAAKAEIDAIHPGLLWSFYAACIPQSWYYRGIFRGLAGDDGEILMLTYEARSKQQVDYWRTLGVEMTHATGMLLNIPEGDEWNQFFQLALEEDQGGYWIFPSGSLTQTEDRWHFSRGDYNLRQPPDVLLELLRRANTRYGR